MARRACRSRDAIQLIQYLSTDGIDERDIERVRQSMRRMSVEGDAIAEPLLQLTPKVISQALDPVDRGSVAREFAGLAKTNREHGALSSGAPPAFVSCPMKEWLECDAAANEQGAYAFRRVKLVPGNREQIDGEAVHVGCDLAY